MPKYCCKVYWEQSCEVTITTFKETPRAAVADLAVEKAGEEIGKLDIRQDGRRKFKLSDVTMVPDSVGCDPQTDVQKLKE
jgi:hypothetical protein